MLKGFYINLDERVDRMKHFASNSISSWSSSTVNGAFAVLACQSQNKHQHAIHKTLHAQKNRKNCIFEIKHSPTSIRRSLR